MPDFDYTKPFRQKNGRAARNPTKSDHLQYPLTVELLTLDGVWTKADFTLDGHFWITSDSDLDLINIEPQEEAMKLDFSRPFMDSQKRPARFCMERKGCPGLSHIWLVDTNGVEDICTTDENGCVFGKPYIVNVPETREVWVNVNKDSVSGKLYADIGYTSKEEADKYAKHNRVGRYPETIRAEFVE